MRKIHPRIKQAIDAQRLGLRQACVLARTEFKDYEFSLKGTMQDVWPHAVWSRLWEIYRMFGCPINEMHDMLCDFNNIQRLFREWKYEFYWYFDPGYRFTIFDVRERYDEEFGLHIRGTDSGDFKVRYLSCVPSVGRTTPTLPEHESES